MSLSEGLHFEKRMFHGTFAMVNGLLLLKPSIKYLFPFTYWENVVLDQEMCKDTSINSSYCFPSTVPSSSWENVVVDQETYKGLCGVSVTLADGFLNETMCSIIGKVTLK